MLRSATLAAALVGALLAGPAAAQFSVTPVLLPFEGGATAATVTVRNEADRALSFRFYTGDFEQDEAGQHDYFELGTHRASCADRLAVVPDGATLAPGERRELTVTMAPGAATCWSGVFVETREWDAAGVSVGQRVMVKAYGVVDGAVGDASVVAVEATASGDTVTVGVTVDNHGTRPLRPQGVVEVRALDGSTVSSHAVEPFSLLPGHRRRLSLEVPAPATPGRYLAVPILDIGTDDLIGGQAGFRVPAPGADEGG